MASNRDFITDPFKGTCESITSYFTFYDAFMLDIGDNKVASVLTRKKVSTSGIDRDKKTMIYYNKLERKWKSDEYTIVNEIEKRNKSRIQEQEKEDSDARIIIGILKKLSTEDALNIVHKHNRNNNKTPLEKVKLILGEFNSTYKGSIVTAREEFDEAMRNIEKVNVMKDLPGLISKIEKIKIEVESLYTINTNDSDSMVGYSNHQLLLYLLQRLDESENLSVIRKMVSDSYKNDGEWETVKLEITKEIKGTVKSIPSRIDNYKFNDNMASTIMQTQVVKSYKACFDMMNNNYCSRGNRCNFAHDANVVRKAIDDRNNRNSYNNNNNNTSTSRNDRNNSRTNGRNEGNNRDRSRSRDVFANQYNNNNSGRTNSPVGNNSGGSYSSGSPLRSSSSRKALPGTPLHSK